MASRPLHLHIMYKAGDGFFVDADMFATGSLFFHHERMNTSMVLSLPIEVGRVPRSRASVCDYLQSIFDRPVLDFDNRPRSYYARGMQDMGVEQNRSFALLTTYRYDNDVRWWELLTGYGIVYVCFSIDGCMQHPDNQTRATVIFEFLTAAAPNPTTAADVCEYVRETLGDIVVCHDDTDIFDFTELETMYSNRHKKCTCIV